MITEIQGDLIDFLKSIGLGKSAALAVVNLAKTDENRLKLMRMMAERYTEKGKVTEDDIGKMLLLLVGERKSSVQNSTRTAADTE